LSRARPPSCRRSIGSATLALQRRSGLRVNNFDEIGLDGDNFGNPRIELHVVANMVLKVIESPSIPVLRKEYPVELYKITEDFTGKNPVYAWRDDQGYQVRVFSPNVKDKVLSITRVMKQPAKGLDQNEVMMCR